MVWTPAQWSNTLFSDETRVSLRSPEIHMELLGILWTCPKIKYCPSERVSNTHDDEHILTELCGDVRAILGPYGAF
jgi:hypothetical protein